MKNLTPIHDYRWTVATFGRPNIHSHWCRRVKCWSLEANTDVGLQANLSPPVNQPQENNHNPLPSIPVLIADPHNIKILLDQGAPSYCFHSVFTKCHWQVWSMRFAFCAVMWNGSGFPLGSGKQNWESRYIPSIIVVSGNHFWEVLVLLLLLSSEKVLPPSDVDTTPWIQTQLTSQVALTTQKQHESEKIVVMSIFLLLPCFP